MNAAQILQLVAQALAVLPSLVEAGINIVDRVRQIQDLAAAGAAGTATDDQVAKVRAQLDADLAEFNSPLPDA